MTNLVVESKELKKKVEQLEQKVTEMKAWYEKDDEVDRAAEQWQKEQEARLEAIEKRLSIRRKC